MEVVGSMGDSDVNVGLASLVVSGGLVSVGNDTSIVLAVVDSGEKDEDEVVLAKIGGTRPYKDNFIPAPQYSWSFPSHFIEQSWWSISVSRTEGKARRSPQ